MRKIILFLTGILIMMIGCSKNEGEQSFEYLRLSEYGLLGAFDNIDRIVVHEINDSTIYFSGKLKSSTKIGLIIFNSNTKEKIVDVTTFENDQMVVDDPYNGKKTLTILYSHCGNIVKNGNTTVVFIQTPGLVITSSSEIGYTTHSAYHYLIIRNNRVIKSIYMQDSCSNIIIKWGNSFILGGCYNGYLYNPDGELVIETDYYTIQKISSLKIIPSPEEILNEFEAIFIDNPNYVSRFDLRDGRHVWQAQIDLSKLDRPRIDSSKLIGKTETHFTYEVSYTEYSGNKGVIKFRVNIETGEIEYL